MIKHSLIVLIILLFLPLSCNRNTVYDQYNSINSSGWTWNDNQVFEVELTDTINLHNLYIQVRHTVEYPLSNLYMFVHVQGPTGQSLTDTVNFILAQPDGKWLGSGVSKLKELRMLYRKNTIFGESGIYKFVLEQGMRSPELPVTDVGILIEKSHL